MVNRRLLRVKVIQILYSYFISEYKDLKVAEKELFFSIRKTYDLYHNLMNLLFELQRVASVRIEKAKKKRVATYEDLNPNTRFINNRVLRLLKDNAALISYTRVHKLSWANYPDLPAHLYDKLIATEEYKNYMSSEAQDNFNEDKKIVLFILEFVFAENELLFHALEEQSIYWIDDFEYAISMVMKTLRGFNKKCNELTRLMPMFKNAEDEEFARKLLRKTVLKHKELIDIVNQFTINWDIDRVAFMDKIIMQLAICEIKEFPTIPAKVSLNEYIELAKFYSTGKSSIFINGILDKVVNSFIEEGTLHKPDTEEIKKTRKSHLIIRDKKRKSDN